MIRLLENLALLKEVIAIGGNRYKAANIKKNHPHKIVIIKHTAYVYKDILEDSVAHKVTNLDDYVPLGEFEEFVSISRTALRERIYFMNRTGIKIFDYKLICNQYFLKIDDEFKYLLQNYQPFIASLKDLKRVKHCKLIGDLKVGFY